MERLLNEIRNQNVQLKIQLSKANKVITREIGENTDIDLVNSLQLSNEKKLLKGDSTWRGRAQKIDLLKVQIKYEMHRDKINVEN